MRVSIQEFKSHLSQYVSQAQVGELIELTSHRKVVARLIGVPPSDAIGVNKLLTAGVASWQGGKPSGASITLRANSKPISALVLEDRE